MESQAQMTFGTTLKQMIAGAGMRPADIPGEVERLYGPSVHITEGDMSRFLSDKAIPKLQKFAAIVDVLGLTHSEIARLVRLSHPRISLVDAEARM